MRANFLGSILEAGKKERDKALTLVMGGGIIILTLGLVSVVGILFYLYCTIISFPPALYAPLK